MLWIYLFTLSDFHDSAFVTLAESKTQSWRGVTWKKWMTMFTNLLLLGIGTFLSNLFICYMITSILWYNQKSMTVFCVDNACFCLIVLQFQWKMWVQTKGGTGFAAKATGKDEPRLLSSGFYMKQKCRPAEFSMDNWRDNTDLRATFKAANVHKFQEKSLAWGFKDEDHLLA